MTARTGPPASSASADQSVRCGVEIGVIDTAIELVESYRLRHDVYGALGYLPHANASELEIDEFDGHAIAFGAFDLASGAMIGTLRLVTDQIQPVQDAVIRSVVEGIGDRALTAQALAPRRRALPSLVSGEVIAALDAFNPGRFPVYELSRTIVHPDHRGGGVSRGLMALGLAHAARSAPAVLVGSCLAEHVAMYRRYGYAPLALPGRAAVRPYFDSVGQVAVAVACRTDDLPEPTSGHVGELVRALGSGTSDRVLEIGRGSSAVVRLAAARRSRRRTLEW